MVGAASRAIWCPTAAEPVNDTAPIRGSVVSRTPTSTPPVTSWTAPAGPPAATSASRRTCTIHSVASGVCGAGLMITGHPAASAGATLCAASSSG